MIVLYRLTIYLIKKIPPLPAIPLPSFKLKWKSGLDFAYLKMVFYYSLSFLLILIVIEGIAISMGLYYHFRIGLPEPSPEAMASMPESTFIYDRNGEFLYEVHGDVKRRFIPLEEIPLYMQQATIAIEDKNFYKHHGFDPIAIARAFFKNLEDQQISQGASTITQQLARTLFLDQDKKYTRKIKELILAIEIENRYSKDEILEMYLNNIPYGSIAYGVSAASEIYLNKPASELNLTESAYLAALPKAPTNYSPFGGNKKALDKRAEQVLLAMKDAGFLTNVEALHMVMQDNLEFRDAPTMINAPHFVFYVLDELKKKYGENRLREGGLRITTSLDLAMQRKAEEVVAKWGEFNEEKYGAGNASLVSLDPSSGEILVMVGSRDYFEEKIGAFNVATSLRQPGSSFKPYVYATAISKGLSPDDFILDNPTNFAQYNYGVDYRPRNYDGKFHGRISIRKALAGSLNIPAVKVLVRTGIDDTIDLAESLGLSTLGERNRFGPSLALGGAEVKLLEHAAALGVFGNEGRKQKMNPVLEIRNSDNDIVFQAEHGEGEQVVHPHTAYWINSILSDPKARSYVFGAKSKLEIEGFEVAAKTGTTQDFHDAWTIGYTPKLATGVWSGNNDNSPMKPGANGYVVATPIWREFMQYALERTDNKKFVKPDDLDDQKIVDMYDSDKYSTPKDLSVESGKNEL